MNNKKAAVFILILSYDSICCNTDLKRKVEMHLIKTDRTVIFVLISKALVFIRKVDTDPEMYSV